MSERAIVIAHRGASGERPEHTRSAYERAIAQGADFIEPDLVMSRDGVLVCSHENDISQTTDVADHAAFAARRATKTIDGQRIEGWFAEDFTLEELKRLRRRERLPQVRPENRRFDGHDEILTFDEALTIARDGGVGIYPELKHPSFLRALGHDPETALVQALTRFGWAEHASPVFIQCFEIGTLRRLSERCRVRRIFLMHGGGRPFDEPQTDYAAFTRPDGLDRLASVVDGIGVEKGMIAPRGANGATGAPTTLIADAHQRGLLVHAWTFRAENMFLPLEFRQGEAGGEGYERAHGDLAGEIALHVALGVDGVFCDFPAIASGALAP